ncbi:MAG TPA: hypothetical protein VFH78_08995 [Candidatus Thermoplasmatota archaeon]|nr:hypothetical protein [Candidatus Thermoplasmatota archaeon]
MRAALLLSVLCLLPTTLAAPPALDTWDGVAHVRAFLANATTLCKGEGLSKLVVEREMERATFTVTVRTACVPALTLRGELTPDGWRFRDDFGLQGGFFAPNDDGTWRLEALVDTCPEHMICEFPHGVRVSGVYGGPLVTV